MTKNVTDADPETPFRCLDVVMFALADLLCVCENKYMVSVYACVCTCVCDPVYVCEP